MQLKYVHYFGNESNESILEVYGLKSKLEQIDKLKPVVCPDCSEANKIDSKYCSKCRLLLTYDECVETLEKQKQKQDEITKLRNEFDEMKSTMKNMTGLMRLKLESDKEEDYEKYQRQKSQIYSINLLDFGI
jgi:hypothetical protein